MKPFLRVDSIVFRIVKITTVHNLETMEQTRVPEEYAVYLREKLGAGADGYDFVMWEEPPNLDAIVRLLQGTAERFSHPCWLRPVH